MPAIKAAPTSNERNLLLKNNWDLVCRHHVVWSLMSAHFHSKTKLWCRLQTRLPPGSRISEQECLCCATKLERLHPGNRSLRTATSGNPVNRTGRESANSLKSCATWDYCSTPAPGVGTRSFRTGISVCRIRARICSQSAAAGRCEHACELRQLALQQHVWRLP